MDTFAAISSIKQLDNKIINSLMIMHLWHYNVSFLVINGNWKSSWYKHFRMPHLSIAYYS